jgi:Tol biopolymer transport system component
MRLPWGARFSPDGRTILFADGPPVNMALFVGPLQLQTIDIDGKDRRTILGPIGRAQPGNAVWSPDGKEIAVNSIEFTGEEGGPITTDKLVHRLAIVSADGKNLRRIDLPEGLRFSVGDWR